MNPRDLDFTNNYATLGDIETKACYKDACLQVRGPEREVSAFWGKLALVVLGAVMVGKALSQPKR